MKDSSGAPQTAQARQGSERPPVPCQPEDDRRGAGRLKLYHPLDRRDFRDETLYRDGEFIKERRMRVALDQKTRYGRELQGSLWVASRVGDARKKLDGGVAVPRPIEGTQDAILMSYIGDEDVPAPRLHEYQHDDRDELASLWEQLHRAHRTDAVSRRACTGTSSSYNILVRDGEVTPIDFRRRWIRRRTATPSRSWSATCAGSASTSNGAGSHRPWQRIAHDLWTAWLFCRPGPRRAPRTRRREAVPADSPNPALRHARPP